MSVKWSRYPDGSLVGRCPNHTEWAIVLREDGEMFVTHRGLICAETGFNGGHEVWFQRMDVPLAIFEAAWPRLAKIRKKLTASSPGKPAHE